MPEAAPLPSGDLAGCAHGRPMFPPGPGRKYACEGPWSCPHLHLDSLLANRTLLAKPARLWGRG